MKIIGDHSPPSFDWYQATFPGTHHTEVLAKLEAELKLTDIQFKDYGGHGYKEHADLIRGKEKFGQLYFKGNADPHFKVTSHRAIEGAAMCRRAFPEHRVSRADVCFDWRGEGAWNTLYPICDQAGRDHGLKGYLIDPLNDCDGHTLRLGGDSSNVTCNLYEKGFEQMKKKHNGGDDEVDENWVRWELRIRPKKEAKKQFAVYDESQMVGASKWSMDLSERLAIAGVERVQVDPRTDSPWHRTHGYMIAQYGTHLLDGAQMMFEDAGEPEDVNPLDMILELLRGELLQHARDTKHPLACKMYVDRITGEIL